MRAVHMTGCVRAASGTIASRSTLAELAAMLMADSRRRFGWVTCVGHALETVSYIELARHLRV